MKYMLKSSPEHRDYLKLFGSTVIIIITFLLLTISDITYKKTYAEVAKNEEIYKILISGNPKDAIPLLINLFDRLDLSVNNGNGYKDYLGNQCVSTGHCLAWGESYIMQAYADMFEATDNMKYLDKLYSHIISVIKNRDDYKGKSSVPCWGTDYYSKGGKWEHYAVHTAMITYPMLEFVYIVRKYNVQKYFPTTDFILDGVEESVNYHNKEWNGKFGLYVSPGTEKILATNMEAAMGRSLLFLHKLTGNNSYKEKVYSIAKVIKKSLKDNGWGYVWGTLPYMVEDPRIEDISHGAITVDFIRLCYENNIVFNEDDMKKIAFTISNIANQGRFPVYIDGKGGYVFDYEITASRWIPFARFDKKLYNEIVNLLFKNYEIENNNYIIHNEDIFGTVMLSISQLIKYIKQKV
jgi:hypothetical protein